MNEHVDDLIGECANNLYAMNVLRAHGMKKEGLEEVFRAKILSRIMYAYPAWWRLASQRDIDRINGFLKKLKCYDNGLFLRTSVNLLMTDFSPKLKIIYNHVLYKFLPGIKSTGYNLRKRAHTLYSLPIKDDRNFMNPVLSCTNKVLVIPEPVFSFCILIDPYRPKLIYNFILWKTVSFSICVSWLYQYYIKII